MLTDLAPSGAATAPHDDENGQPATFEVYNLDGSRSPRIPKRQRLFEVSLLINSTPTVCVLDSGALLDVMSHATARELRIEPSAAGESVHIRDVHQRVSQASLSEKVRVEVPNKCHVFTQFALLPSDSPTIIASQTLGALKMSINFSTRAVLCDSAPVPCYVVEEPPTVSEPAADTIQQQSHRSVIETIRADVPNWSTQLTPAQAQQAEALLGEFSDVWYEPKIGLATTVTMEIKVRGLPRRVAARPTPVHLRGELNRQIDDLLRAGVIEPAPDCRWVSSARLVPKPRSTKWRLVTDYRYVNSLIEDDGYQIPNAQDLLIRLSGAKLFTLIDLNWGFWNVSLDPDSYQYTGFTVPERGVFIWKVMPFGLRTSPTIFQRAIEKALRDLIDEGHVSVYIDDIIVYTRTADEHLLLLQRVFARLRATRFFVNWEKLQAFREEALYLGHLISANKLKPDPRKLQGLIDANAPRDKRSVLSFCAAANYLRSYIPRFSEVMEPLTSLTGKYTKFVWGEAQEDAFQQAKQAIADAVYLTMPKWDRPFVLFTDASEIAIAAALAQLDDGDDGLSFIAFASKKLAPAQRNWSTTERELYAIVWACEHFENYIKGSRPLVYSDHKALTHLLTLDSPKAKRWALRLSEFNPCVLHINGTQNNVADWLSRSLPDDDDYVPNYVYVPPVYHLVHEISDSFVLPDPKEFAAAAKLEEATLPPGTLDWYEGTAYGRRSKRIYIPERYRMDLLLWFHMSRFGGHQGVTRTTNRLRKYVWWPNMQLAVVDFINSCPLCNATKPLKATGGVAGALSKPQLFQLVSLDYIGKRTYSNRSVWILVIVDHYSRFMSAIAMDSIASPHPRQAFRDHWISKFGAPLAVLCDRDPTFTSQEFKDFVLQTCKARLHYSSTEYPQGNGINESAHRILETALRTYPWGGRTELEQVLSDATVLYNCTPNRMIGDTPASLAFGQDLHLPGLEDFEPTSTEEARLTQLRNFRGTKLLLEQLQLLEDFASPSTRSPPASRDFKVGDIVTYRLSESERNKAKHITQENKYKAIRSFPQRVTKVTPTNLTMVPLWTRGAPRSAPREQCKLITTFVPELMREQTQLLYPSLPWLVPGAPAPKVQETLSRAPQATEKDEGDTNRFRSKKRFRSE